MRGFQKLGYRRQHGVTDLGKNMEKRERDAIVDGVIFDALKKMAALQKWVEDYKVYTARPFCIILGLTCIRLASEHTGRKSGP